MPVSTIHLTEKEKIIFDYAQRLPNITAQEVAEYFSWCSYTSATRFLNSLDQKGYMIKSSSKGPKGYQFMVPRVQRGNESLVIPFNGDNHSLADLLLYISQEVEVNDFQKYGQVFSAGVYHLLFRRIQQRGGENPSSPSPTEIHRFIQSSIRTYKSFVQLLETVENLPIYGEDDTILEFFPEVNEKYMLEREVHLFQPYWKQGIASVFGLRSKFRHTMELMKKDFTERYGKAKKL